MKTKLAPLFFAITVFCVCAFSTRGYCAPPVNGRDRGGAIHFVPNSQEFWDFSKNWTTNYGPAYRDAALGASSFLPCTGQYALCFHSGPKPLPCKLTDDGRFANCECTVQTGLNFVLMTGILNAKVYQDTVNVCGPDGSDCTAQPDKAPVCKAIAQGKVIPGADVISTYSPHDESDLTKLLTQAPGKPILTICPKAPYAGCMTAPCKITKSGHAECSCPVFWGIFQLTGAGAQCTLGDDLVNSASYAPARDVLP
ncbi:MAG: hypothetical protein ACREQC_05855 [Candidatus Binataceae bacterium]